MDRVEFDYWKPRDVSRLLSLVEAERRYFQEMMAMLPVGVALVSPALDVTMTNRAFRRLMGLERVTAGERRLDELFGIPSLRDRVRESLETRSTRTILSHDTNTAKGKRTLLLSLQPFRDWDDDGAAEILVTLEDVTDMVAAQLPAPVPEALPPVPTPAMAAASAMIMAKLSPVEPPTAPEPADAPQPLMLASPAAAFMTDCIFWRVDAAGLRFESVEIPAALADASLPKDAWSAGGDFWSGRVAPAHLPLVKSFYEQALAGTPLHSVEYRAITANPTRTLWLRDVIRAVRDESGAVTHLEGATSEVTRLRQREDSAAQAQKIDALTRLAGRVAHECNNLLTILGGHGEELLHALSPDNPLRSNAQEILTAGDRLSAFMQQLNTFIKHPSPEPGKVELDKLIGEHRDELRQLLPSAIRLIINPGAPSAMAIADAALVLHALRTFAQRGAEAMRSEGVISIETSATVAADPTAGGRAGLAPGRYLQIAVRDTGHAIHPELVQQLFEPPAGEEAPRLNLAAIYKSIREMGGDLYVTSEFDRGSCFTVLLPRGADALAPAPPTIEAPAVVEPPAASPLTAETPRTETILVVEDEAGIRGLIRRILGRQNYDVIEASNGRQALEIAREHPGVIDMLLTDVVMPEMGGFDLAQELLKTRPKTKVLFISGYTGLSGFDPSQLPTGAGFLQKPFTLNALLAKVREVFAQKLNG